MRRSPERPDHPLPSPPHAAALGQCVDGFLDQVLGAPDGGEAAQRLVECPAAFRASHAPGGG